MVNTQTNTRYIYLRTIKYIFLALCLISFSAVLLYSTQTVHHKSIEDLSRLKNIKSIGLHDNDVQRRWRKVGQSNECYVFSAYYKRFEHVVEMVGILKKTRLNSTFNCLFPEGLASNDQYRYSAELEHVDAPNARILFQTVYIRCSIPLHINPSIVTLEMDNNSTTLSIIYTETTRNIYNLSICFPSFFRNFSQYERIIDAIESNIMFGVQFFTVYKHSVTDKVDKVFRHYVERGLMEVINWDTPKTNIHHDGQWSHLQDCHLSHRYKSKYLMILDVDELIVPHKHTNLMELMRDLEKDGNYSAGSYMFRHAFFEVSQDEDNSSFPQKQDVEQLKITSLRHVWRAKTFHDPGHRTKTIHSPSRVLTAGIHFTMKMVPGFREQVVDPTMAYVHHYRTKWKIPNKTKDDFMRTYTRRLVPTVKRVHSMLGFI